MHYAETHFKFKLPWSLLYRPWPEILTDAPFQFVPGKMPQLWIVVRDAHRFSVTIKSLEIGIVEYQLENQLTRNFKLPVHLDGQVITAQTIGLRRTKREAPR